MTYDYAREIHEARLEALEHFDERELIYGPGVPSETELAAEAAEEKR